MSIKVGISSGHDADNVNGSPDLLLKEWQINLKIKEKVAEKLVYNNFVYVDLNPERYGYTLEKRADIANKSNVNAVYSIHCNAMGWNWTNTGGIETYAHPESPLNGGKKLAKLTHSRLICGTPLINRGVKYANFAILRLTKAPAALGEMAFMDNKEESKLLISDEYQEECAREITQGICDFFGTEYKDNKNNTISNYDLLKKEYEKLRNEYTKLHEENIEQKNKIDKVQDYIKKQISEMEYVERKYFT